MALLSLYRALTVLLAPLVGVMLRQRQRKGKEHATRMSERLGHASLPRPDGALLWLHAASVGEANAVLPLIGLLQARYPQTRLLLTTGTVTSARLMEQKLPAGVLHQFVPVDTSAAVSRFLRHWRPDMAIWTESELWPNLILHTKRHGCPMILLNARMSEKSARGWQRFPRSIRQLLGAFDLICAQSGEDAARLRDLGAAGVEAPGNLKHDSPPLPADAEALATLQAELAGRPLWVAASTHPGEEALLADIHRQVASDYPGLLTVIVPRHPERGAKLAGELAATGIPLALRSRGEAVTAQTGIYLADTLGELGLFYRLAPIAFMGGSLVPHGGQNPLEPARLGCAILTGPHIRNFTAICEELAQHQALTRVPDAQALAAELRRLLADPAACAALAAAAESLAAGKRGVNERVLALLAPFLEGIA